MAEAHGHFYKSAERDTIRYVSGSTVYEETLQDGRYIGLYWSSAGQVHRENVVEKIPSRPREAIWHRMESFVLEVDGQALDGRWAYTGGASETAKNGCTLVSVELKHEVRPVSVKVMTQLDSTNIISRWLEIQNLSDSPAAIGKVHPCSGRLWDNQWSFNWGDVVKMKSPIDLTKETMYSIGYLEGSQLDTRMLGIEGNFMWKDMTDEYFYISRLERKPYCAPFYIVRNNLTGERFMISLAWSAGFETFFRHERIDHMLHFSTGPAAPSPLRVMAPGEIVKTPAVHIGPVHGETDECVQEWYRHLRASVLPKRPKGKEMYTVAGRVLEEPGDWILREMDIAAEMGAEAFMMDAGWYGDDYAGWTQNRGDWYEGDFLPEGKLNAMREYAHSKGMTFGLWMEPEAIEIRSKLFKKHPEWRIKYDASDTSVENDGVINMAIPEAAAYVRDSIIGFIRDKKLDFFKLDYNMNIVEGGRYDIMGYTENQAWRHFENLYGIFEEVLEKYPETALENCASGGGRNDLGTLSRFHYASQSDWSLFPFSIRAVNAMTLFLPPETLCYYHNHINHASGMANLDTHLRVALFCSPIFVGYGGQDADRSTAYFQKTREYTELLKGFCRSIMISPDVYHHTPDIGLLSDAQWCVLEYAKAGKGYTGLFRLGSDADQKVYHLYLRGVKEDERYEVTFYNSGTKRVIDGSNLIHEGLRIRLEAKNTSELVLYERI